jgi:hypothetical protein
MRRSFVLPAAIALLALSGCGGCDDTSPSSPPHSSDRLPPVLSAREYQDRATKATAEYGAAGRELARLRRRSSPARTARALARFQERVNGTVAALQALRPPPALTLAHTELVASLHDVALACQPTIDAGHARAKSKFRRALRRLRADLQRRLGPRARRAARRVDEQLAQL